MLRVLSTRASHRYFKWQPFGLNPQTLTKTPGSEVLRSAIRFVACQDAVGSAEVRDRFLSLLKRKNGDTKDAAIVEELEQLEKANPTPKAALRGEYLDGDWRQISRSDFPNRLSPDQPLYTLGRLAFNMYEPIDMVFRLDRVMQPVRPLLNSDNSAREFEIVAEMTCVDDRYPEFKAVMLNCGRINPGKDKSGNDLRLIVSFAHGSIGPSAEMTSDLQAQWNQTFKPRERNMFLRGVMRMAMGFETNPMDEDGVISYKLRRSPKGWLDIVYLDDMLRVTRGNRGSVVVCERGQASHPQTL